jgi:multidrug efflux pump subunit AcrA (membrane-fusion protein)
MSNTTLDDGELNGNGYRTKITVSEPGEHSAWVSGLAPRCNRCLRGLFMVVLLALVAEVSTSKAEKPEVIRADSVLIRLIDEVEIPARATGVLLDVHMVEGQVVKKASLLGKIDDTEAKLLGQRTKIELKIARENVEDDVAVRAAEKAGTFALAEHGRLERADRELPGSVLKSELEEAKLLFEQAQLDLERAHRDIKLAKIAMELKKSDLKLSIRNFDLCKITSPLDGVVVEVLKRPGEWVQPGDKVARIVRMDRLRAEGFVLAQQLPAKLEGSSVAVSLTQSGTSGKQYLGKIVFVSPEINPVSGQVRVWAEIDNPEGLLKPGMRATMAITVGQRPPGTQSNLRKVSPFSTGEPPFTPGEDSRALTLKSSP